MCPCADCRNRLCRIHQFCIKTYPVGNVPPERFQNQGTASGTQGGAVLFAPPSKSCRFSHPPSPCAQKQGRRDFAVCGQRLRGHVPSKNTSPTALSWISLTSPTISVLFVSARCERIRRQTLTMFHVKHPLTLLSASAPVRRGRPYRRTPAPASLYSSHRSRKPAVPDGSPD